ncbi:putative anti-sigma regulatory factor, serine/threonine protein kinase [Methanoregula boonei 6A8]|uniref:Putative anti-sigma regulatory factor, serine/threonine protein kinase n=1 Tax=Methanoregula boonei (strain DSM 21154 / JCM 14090 / 6A8) TaxID=456442 RepID=A7I7G7_METB6|nr:ATP-binding protein [Methanoregula boonei]ABS55678.1 putative anti-sigma regulatory factor, serine/threonine protein kinase [Methanoregula boonei 6A8]
MPALTEFVIPARLEAVPGVAVAIEEFMKGTGFSVQAILDIQLALEEVIANSVEHGYQGSEGEIAICCEFRDGVLTVEISDRAPAFNPLVVADPDITSPLEERKIGGLGIYLVRQVTDTVAYRYNEGKNILTLTKKKDR